MSDSGIVNKMWVYIDRGPGVCERAAKTLGGNALAPAPTATLLHLLSSHLSLRRNFKSLRTSTVDVMLPPIDPVVLQRNPNFEILYKDLCTRKLNPNGSSRDTKKQRVHDEIRRVRLFPFLCSEDGRHFYYSLHFVLSFPVAGIWSFVCLQSFDHVSVHQRDFPFVSPRSPQIYALNRLFILKSHANFPLDLSHRSHNPAHNANPHNIALNPAIQSHPPPTRLARSYRNSNRPTQRPSSSIGSRHSV